MQEESWTSLQTNFHPRKVKIWIHWCISTLGGEGDNLNPWCIPARGGRGLSPLVNSHTGWSPKKLTWRNNLSFHFYPEFQSQRILLLPNMTWSNNMHLLIRVENKATGLAPSPWGVRAPSQTLLFTYTRILVFSKTIYHSHLLCLSQDFILILSQCLFAFPPVTF